MTKIITYKSGVVVTTDGLGLAPNNDQIISVQELTPEQQIAFDQQKQAQVAELTTQAQSINSKPEA